MRGSDRSNNKARLFRPLPKDPETGIYARNFFLLRLKEERERSRRFEFSFCLLILDVDSLSSFLDDKGADPGKRRLEKGLVEIIRQNSRSIDILGWVQAKKMGILMPQSSRPEAVRFREKICREILNAWPTAEQVCIQDSFQIHDFKKVSSCSHKNRRNGKPGPGESPPDEKLMFADVIERNDSFSFKGLVKRMMDITGSFGALLVAAVPMLVVAVLIKLTSRGPILFRQERVGFLGKRFTFFKFRTMHTNADSSVHEQYVTKFIKGANEEVNKGTDEKPLYKLTNDSRVTLIGRFLRRTSLDEFPQFFNVLRGDMSLVGPRPPIPYELDVYKFWHAGRIFEVKPGLTGLWQINGRNGTTFDDMVRLDLQYANNWSLGLDLKILFKTFRVFLPTEGAH